MPRFLDSPLSEVEIINDALWRLGDRTPRCPWCGGPLDEGEEVDVGVGYQKVAPDHCPSCGALEIGPYDKDRAHASAEELRRGFYQGRW